MHINTYYKVNDYFMMQEYFFNKIKIYQIKNVLFFEIFCQKTKKQSLVEEIPK